jgi:Major Facilitator Superfamily
MPLCILRLHSLTTSSALRGIAATGMFSSFFLGALYLEHVRGYSALRTGLGFLPMSLSVAVLSVGVTARLVHRFGAKRTLVPGLLLMIAGLMILANADAQTAYFPGLFAAFTLLGLGAGLSFMPLLGLAMAEVPKPDAGLASGIVNVSMWVSAAIGVAARARPHRGGRARGRAPASANAYAGSSRGSARSSQRGIHQFAPPRSCITAGTRTMRTTVASTRIAVAMPIPRSLRKTSSATTKARKTATMIAAAAVITRAVLARPSATARLVRPSRRYSSRTRESRKTS